MLMKTLLLFLFTFTALTAQSINNKNCALSADQLVKSSIGNLDIYRQIDDSNKDSIVVHGYVANSDNYFDMVIMRENPRKIICYNMEYSPKQEDFHKTTYFEYRVKKEVVKEVRTSYLFPGAWSCIGFPVDMTWMDDWFSKTLTSQTYIILFEEVIKLYPNKGK